MSSFLKATQRVWYQIIGSLSQPRPHIIMVTKSYVIVVTKNLNPSLLREWLPTTYNIDQLQYFNDFDDNLVSPHGQDTNTKTKIVQLFREHILSTSYTVTTIQIFSLHLPSIYSTSYVGIYIFGGASLVKRWRRYSFFISPITSLLSLHGHQQLLYVYQSHKTIKLYLTDRLAANWNPITYINFSIIFCN